MKRRILFLTILLFYIISIVPYKSQATIVDGGKELARQVLSEGAVLLKNDKDVLPLNNKDTIAVFGSGQINFYVGGGGSSVMFTDKIISPLEGLLEAEEKGLFKIYKPLIEKYKEYVGEYKQLEAIYGADAFGTITYKGQSKTHEMKVSDEEIKDASENATIALYFISRFATEGDDMTKEAYCLTKEEKELLGKLSNNFDKVCMILNISSHIDTSFLDDYRVDSLLVAWYYGQEGGRALADIFSGKVNPSGKLTNTFAKSYDDYLSSLNFDQGQNVYYEEDIFVGYRQFETFDPNYERVNFEFGFGMSYTDFEIRDIVVKSDSKKVYIEANVKNIGKLSGKEVIQVYYSSPQGILGKASKELAAFYKTKEIKAGKSEKVKLSFKIEDMAAYDDSGKVQQSAYILEEGDYKIYVGNSVRKSKEAGEIVIDKLTICRQLTERAYSTRLTKRLLASGEYEDIRRRGLNKDKESISGYVNTSPEPEGIISLLDLYKDRTLMDSFLKQLTIEDMARLAGGQKAKIGYAAGAIVGDLLRKYKMPTIEVTDGSQGVRVDSLATYFPSSIALASTWNLDLAREVGSHIGKECRDSKIDIWLGPAMNIIRNPLCGRNFEYYSEDPYLTGKIAASVTLGVQEHNIGVCLKHYVANNKEKGRGPSDSQVTERALREIYLKGFEICVREANPVSIMSTCGIVNGTGAAGNYDLMSAIPRDEWGFTGFFMSDWANMDDEISELHAGHNVSMPSSNFTLLISGNNKGTVTREQLEENTRVLLNNFMKLHSYMRIGDPSYSLGKLKLDMQKDSSLDLSDYLWKEDNSLSYRIEVQAEGTYSLSQTLEGSFKLFIDGREVFDKVYLSKGTHEIELEVNEDDFLLKEIVFSPLKVKLPFGLLVKKYSVIIVISTVIIIMLLLLIIFKKRSKKNV